MENLNKWIINSDNKTKVLRLHPITFVIQSLQLCQRR